MNPTFSTYLDTVRFCAAVTVLFSHFAYERFSGGDFIWLRELNLGSDAVVAFFVLSGLVIAYTGTMKDRTASAYLFNRATRILSVAVPALLITFALDRLGAAIDPAGYDGWWYERQSLPAMLWHGLSFSSEWWIPGARLGTNGPYWSLSYEVAYYALFAAAFFLTGPSRIIVLTALAILVGLKVLLLLPVWLLGVLVWRSIRRGLYPRSTALGIAMIVLPPLVYGLCLIFDAPAHLSNVTTRMAGLDGASLAKILGFSDEFLWNSLIGALFATHLVGFAGWCARHGGAWRSSVVTWFAGASFSLYLVHYPALQFFDAILPGEASEGWRQLLMLCATLIVCLVFAQLFERPLGRLRRRCLALAKAARNVHRSGRRQAGIARQIRVWRNESNV